MCGFCPSDALKVQAVRTSGLASYQASGLIQIHVLNHKRTTSRSSAARVVCPDCGNSWPNKAEYGTECYKCNKKPKVSTWINPADEPKCTCGDAYRQSYGRRCVDCEGEPSPAQRDAVREKHGCRGVDDRVGEDGGGADNPSVPETETRQPPETRGQSPDSSVSPEHGSPPNGGEPGPNALRFFADLAQWTVGKRTPATHRSARRRMARAARQELADLARGDA